MARSPASTPPHSPSQGRSCLSLGSTTALRYRVDARLVRKVSIDWSFVVFPSAVRILLVYWQVSFGYTFPCRILIEMGGAFAYFGVREEMSSFVTVERLNRFPMCNFFFPLGNWPACARHICDFVRLGSGSGNVSRYALHVHAQARDRPSPADFVFSRVA
jgi:hypothetical protein